MGERGREGEGDKKREGGREGENEEEKEGAMTRLRMTFP